MRESGNRGLVRFWSRCVRLCQKAALGGALVLYLAGGRALALGLLLGAAVGILRFHLRYRALLRGASAAALVRLRLMSYAMSALSLGAAFAWRGQLSPWSCAAGLVLMNASVIAAELLRGGAGARAGKAGGS